jgi:hydrogenase small subunit
VKWNNGTSFPIEAGHGCIGCAEPDFWDRGGFYDALSVTQWGSPSDLAIAGAAGIALGVATGALARKHQKDTQAAREKQP